LSFSDFKKISRKKFGEKNSKIFLEQQQIKFGQQELFSRKKIESRKFFSKKKFGERNLHEKKIYEKIKKI